MGREENVGARIDGTNKEGGVRYQLLSGRQIYTYIYILV